MAASVNNAGAVTVKIDDGQGGGLQTLGYTRNGADETSEVHWLDVPGDQNGGDDGPPIEVQYMGEIRRVRLELTKWDTAVAALIKARVAGATDGIPATPGTMIFTQAKGFRLVLDGNGSVANLDQNYIACIPRMPIEVNKGTKYATLVCEFECHKASNGTLANQTVS